MNVNLVHGVPEGALLKLKARLKGLHDRSYRVLYVAAFGSRVKGTHRPDSDLDVVLVTATGASNMREDQRIMKIVNQIKVDFYETNCIDLDLQIFDHDDIVTRKTKFSIADLRILHEPPKE